MLHFEAILSFSKEKTMTPDPAEKMKNRYSGFADPGAHGRKIFHDQHHQLRQRFYHFLPPTDERYDHGHLPGNFDNTPHQGLLKKEKKRPAAAA